MSKICEGLQLEQKRRTETEIEETARIPHASWIVQEPQRRPDGNIDEELIGLYYSIESQLPGFQSRIIQFIGSHDGEGTTMIAQELGRLVATELRKSVLLFDADSKHKPAPAQSAPHE